MSNGSSFGKPFSEHVFVHSQLPAHSREFQGHRTKDNFFVARDKNELCTKEVSCVGLSSSHLLFFKSKYCSIK